MACDGSGRRRCETESRTCRLLGFLLFFSPYSDSGCARTIVHEHVDRIRSPHALDHDAVCDRPQWQCPEPSAECDTRAQRSQRRSRHVPTSASPRRRRRARRASARRTRWHRTLVLCIGSPRRQRLRILWLIPPPCRGTARCSSRCLCRLRARRTAQGLRRCRRRSFRPIGPPRRAGPPPLSAWRRSCRH